MVDTFRDFSGRHVRPVARMPRPRDLADLRLEVLRAEQDGLGVSAMGAAWAFSAPAYNPGVVLDTRSISGFPEWLQDCVLQPPSGPEVYAAVAAGTPVRDLYLGLLGSPLAGRPALPDGVRQGRSLAPPTLGGAGGQTLAGVVSTGTHGGDVARPPIGDFVRAAVVVGSGGRVRVVQRRSALALDVDRLNRLHRERTGGPDFEEYAQDGGLEAVTTAVGRMGVVYAYVFAVHDETGQSVYEWRYEDRWSRVRAALESGALLSQARSRDEFFQVVLSPLRNEREDRPCYVTRHLTRHTSAVATAWADFHDGRLTQTTSQEVSVARRSEVFEVLGQVFGVDHVTPQVQEVRDVLYALSILVAAAALAVGGPIGALASLPLVCALREFADDLGTLSPNRIFGDVVSSQLNRLSSGPFGCVTVAVIRAIIANGQAPTRPDGQPWLVHGPRGPVMDSYDYREPPLYRGDSVEVFFRSDGQLGRRVEALFEVMEDMQRRGLPLGAYVSLRFLASSRALLATTDPDPGVVTCAVEISMLRGMRGNDEALSRLQAAALQPDNGGRVHWGQQNDLTAAQVADTMPLLDMWRAHLQALEGSSSTFLTPFAASHGLDVHRRTDWTRWEDLTLRAGGDPCVVSVGDFVGDGQYVVLACDRTGRLMLNRQRVDRTETTWLSVSDRHLALSCAPAAQLRRDDGRLEIFAVTAESELGHVYQEEVGGARFSSFNVKTALFGVQQLVERDAIASVQRGDGHLEMYAVEAAGRSRLLRSGTGLLDVLGPLDDTSVSSRFAVSSRTARPDAHTWHFDALIVAVDLSETVRWRLQRGGEWEILPALPDRARVHQVSLLAGRIVVSTTAGLWTADDTTPNEPRPQFGPWQPVPAPIDVEPLAPDNPLRTLSVSDGGWVFALGRTGQMLGLRLQHGTWGRWVGLGGKFRLGSRPAAGVLPDGRVQVVGRHGGGDGSIDRADFLMARRQLTVDTW